MAHNWYQESRLKISKKLWGYQKYSHWHFVTLFERDFRWGDPGKTFESPAEHFYCQCPFASSGWRRGRRRQFLECRTLLDFDFRQSENGPEASLVRFCRLCFLPVTCSIFCRVKLNSVTIQGSNTGTMSSAWSFPGKYRLKYKIKVSSFFNQLKLRCINSLASTEPLISSFWLTSLSALLRIYSGGSRSFLMTIRGNKSFIMSHKISCFRLFTPFLNCLKKWLNIEFTLSGHDNSGDKRSGTSRLWSVPRFANFASGVNEDQIMSSIIWFSLKIDFTSWDLWKSYHSALVRIWNTEDTIWGRKKSVQVDSKSGGNDGSERAWGELR